MTHRSNVVSPARRAERTATENYRELQPEVLATVRHKLASRRMRVDESDLEEAYCQAWHGVCEAIKHGQRVSNLTGMLVEITWRRAVDAYRELRPGQRVELEPDAHPVGHELDARLDDQIKLKRFLRRARDRLSPRERAAVSLCLIHGYTRPEAARLLGYERTQIEKLMDGATKKIGRIVAGIDARGCGEDEWARLIRSYALGSMHEHDRDRPRVAAHVAECESCRRYVDGLRGLAAILPPVVPPLGSAVTIGRNGALAHLQRLFGFGHGAAGAGTGAAGGVAAASATTTVSGAGGGGGLLGSLGTGALLKGAVVLVAGAAAVGVAVHAGEPHRHASYAQTPAASHTASRAPAPADAPSRLATSPAYGAAGGGGRRPARGRARSAGHRALGVRSNATPAETAAEFGFETHKSRRPPSAVRSEPAPVATPSRAVLAGARGASSPSAKREFGFER